MFYAVIAVIVVVVAGGFVLNYLRGKKIKESGIEAEAVVSRIKEVEGEDANGSRTTETIYYVTYVNQEGQSVEAKLGNPPMFLTEGTTLRVKYLPEKPKYVIRVKE